jgi:Protein of unknown function (DUF998)
MSSPDVPRPRTDDAAGRSPRPDGLLALAGAGTFAAIVVLLHFVEKEFEPGGRFISEYVLGDWGWLMNIAFVVLGGSFLALAHGLRRGLSPGRRVTASVRVMYFVGITVVLTGFFNSDSIDDLEADRMSWHGTIHDLLGLIRFVGVVVAAFFLRGVFARGPHWRRFAPHALMFAVTMLGTFVLVLVAPTDSVGVAQRVFVTVDLLWIGTLGCALVGAGPALPNQKEARSNPGEGARSAATTSSSRAG